MMQQAELMELAAVPEGPAAATVVEASLGRSGPQVRLSVINYQF